MTATSIAEGLDRVEAELDLAQSAVADVAGSAIRGEKKTLRGAAHGDEDDGEDVVHQMKRHPLEAVGIAFGVGLLVGIAFRFSDPRRAARPIDKRFVSPDLTGKSYVA